MSDVGARRSGRVQSVERAAALLRAVASAAHPREAVVSALAARCGLNRATAWRILTTLEHEGLVGRDRDTGRWSIGPALGRLVGGHDAHALVRDATPTLTELAEKTGETAAIALPSGGRLRYADEVASPSIVAVHWKERTVPLHATSTGKAYLAFASDEYVESALRAPLEHFTRTTVTDAAALRVELGAIRSSGYSTCRGEYELSAYGVSSPILDRAGRPVAVLSIWGPRHRLPEERFPELGELLVDAAGRLGDTTP